MSRKLIYQSDRVFHLFGYGMNHGRLLLRSGKSGKTPDTRVDVLFEGVRAMEIRPLFNGIKIEEVENLEFLKDQRSEAALMVEPGLKIYSLSSVGYTLHDNQGHSWQGFIVSGSVSVNEDAGDFDSPSALVPHPPKTRRKQRSLW